MIHTGLKMPHIYILHSTDGLNKLLYCYLNVELSFHTYFTSIDLISLYVVDYEIRIQYSGNAFVEILHAPTRKFGHI